MERKQGGNRKKNVNVTNMRTRQHIKKGET
jgi:hypothetical protein